MTKYSDRFSNCARPEVQEVIVVQGTRVQVAKLWEHYTDREKGLAVNYKYGCGAEIVEFLLYLEAEIAELKVRFAALATATAGNSIPVELNENFERIDAALGKVIAKFENLPANGIATTQSVGDVTREIMARIDKVSDEVEKRATPEYIGRIEHALFSRLDEAFEAIKLLSDRVTAIDTTPR